QKELRELVNNKLFVSALAKQGTTLHAGESTDPEFSAFWMTQLIQQAAVDAEFDARHLKVTDANRKEAATREEQRFGGKQVFDAFPKSLRDSIIERDARTLAVLAAFQKAPTDAEARAYYARHKAQFGCASGKDVAHILVSDAATAQEIIDQLRSGADFAT